MSAFLIVAEPLLPRSIATVFLTCSMQYECCDFIASGYIAISACFGFVAPSVHLEPSVTVLTLSGAPGK